MPEGVQVAAMQMGPNGQLEPIPPGMMPQAQAGFAAMHAAGPFPMMAAPGGGGGMVGFGPHPDALDAFVAEMENNANRNNDENGDNEEEDVDVEMEIED